MNDNDEFKQLRKLCELHYQRQIDFSSYRQQLRGLLNKIEAEHRIFAHAQQHREPKENTDTF